MTPLRIDIDAARAGQRLDRVVVEAIDGLGRAGAKRLFAEGRVRVVSAEGTHRGRKGELATPGSHLEVDASAEVAALPDPSLALVVAHEDEAFVVVDKPAGIDSAPLRPGERGTVANALLAAHPGMQGVGYDAREPGLCHRLDRDTSGLLVAAKTAEAFAAFTGALTEGAIDKRYLAVVQGELDDEGRCDGALAPDPADRRRVIVVEEGHPATTTFRVLERASGCLLVEAQASRAYRHQVRVHLAALGAPLLGDLLYGGPEVAGLGRHALHASAIAFGGRGAFAAFEVTSPLPDELASLLRG